MPSAGIEVVQVFARDPSRELDRIPQVRAESRNSCSGP